MKKRLLPNIYICIGYKDIYDDYDTVDIHHILDGIPSIAVLNFLVKQLDRILYAFNDAKTQRQQIRDFCSYVPERVRKRIWDFTKSHNKCIIYETYGCAMAYGFCLQHFVSFEEDDNILKLCEDEMERVFKLILYCNQRWTDCQSEGTSLSDVVDISIKIDLPVVEFKLYKDFKFQIYKAVQFFKFLEDDPHYTIILSKFYKDKKVNCWQEYIGRLFNFYASSLKNRFIKVNTECIDDNIFFDQYCANLEDCDNLWEGYNALNYLRDHFLIDCNHKNYMLLNANLLVDKIYQGLRFDVYKTINAHNITNKKGKMYKNLPDFNSEIGETFSEPQLLYNLVNKTFSSLNSIIYTGSNLKENGLVGEPDLYMRIGEVLYLFEFKDVTLGDKFKYSTNIEETKKAICDRICLLQQDKKKGAGQLHNTIDQIVNQRVMDVFDPGVKNITAIVPVVVTTDRAFSAIGVQNLVAKEYSKFPTIKFGGFISIPIIIEFDTLIDLSYRLHTRTLDFTDIIKKYMSHNYLNLAPFSTYVLDKYKRNANRITTEENDYLFTEAMEYLSALD